MTEHSLNHCLISRDHYSSQTANGTSPARVQACSLLDR